MWDGSERVSNRLYEWLEQFCAELIAWTQRFNIIVVLFRKLFKIRSDRVNRLALCRSALCYSSATTSDVVRLYNVSQSSFELLLYLPLFRCHPYIQPNGARHTKPPNWMMKVMWLVSCTAGIPEIIHIHSINIIINLSDKFWLAPPTHATQYFIN